MVDKTREPFGAEPSGTVLNLYRRGGGRDEPSAAYTPRSLEEHEHATVQVSVLLRRTVAAIGWQTGSGRGVRRRINGGETYVVPSGQPHDFRLQRACGMVNFHIEREALVALSPRHFERGHDLLDELAVIGDPVLEGVAAGVHAAALSPGGLTPLYLDAAWTLFAPQVAQLADVRRSHRPSPHLPAWRLRRALDFIESHLGDPGIRVCDVAVVAGLSPVHFTRGFSQSTGTSPMRYIIGRRLERARERLIEEDASILSIALELGFGSHSHFSEAFRCRFGQTPGACRRRRASTT